MNIYAPWGPQGIIMMIFGGCTFLVEHVTVSGLYRSEFLAAIIIPSSFHRFFYSRLPGTVWLPRQL